jgi:uncharacterized protein (DUF433 family)
VRFLTLSLADKKTGAAVGTDVAEIDRLLALHERSPEGFPADGDPNVRQLEPSGRLAEANRGASIRRVSSRDGHGAFAVIWSEGVADMAALDWSQCQAVESIPGKVSGAWVFKGTRTPVAIIFENLEDGMTIDEVIEQFPVTREQIKAVLEFTARSLDAPVPAH